MGREAMHAGDRLVFADLETKPNPAANPETPQQPQTAKAPPESDAFLRTRQIGEGGSLQSGFDLESPGF
jgi:hypothetical protein